jgi:hypothetical protein
MSRIHPTILAHPSTDTSNIQIGVLIMPDPNKALAFTTKNIDTKNSGEVTTSPISPSLMSGTGENGNMLPRVLTSSTEDSPVRTFQWPATGAVLLETDPDSGTNFSESCRICGHDGRLLRMSLDFYPLTGETISESSLTGFAGSGIASDGRYWTRNTSESRNAADAFSLSQVLQSEPSKKFYLSARAAAGILRRALRRGKELPAPLQAALSRVAEGGDKTSTDTEHISDSPQDSPAEPEVSESPRMERLL